MKWSRAVHHVESLAQTCARMATPSPIFQLRVTELWVSGALLSRPAELETVSVALVVDLPADAVAWCSEPPGAQHWANAAKLSTAPIRVWWRSADVPVWNHRIERPALVWDVAGGVSDETLAALRDGRGEEVRVDAPTAEALRGRLRDELAVSRRALADCTEEYEQRRWKPGKLTTVADALWRASDGYLDLLEATERA